MNITVLNLLLFAPFLLVALITGLVYFRAGYKRGLWRALISLGATVVATLLSLVLSNLVAGWLKAPVTGLISGPSFSQMGVLQGFAEKMIAGVVQDVLSMLLFGIFLFIFLIILKVVSNKVQPDKLKVEKKAYKWGGLGVRAVDTVVVTLLLLLPLYGTLATYVTPVAKLAEMSMGQDSSTVRYLKSAANHPVVSMYKAGPASWVYNGLSGFKVGDAQVDLPKIAETMDEALVKFKKFNSADGEERVKACAELNKYLRDNLIEEDWFYELVCEAAVELETQLEGDGEPEDTEEAEQYLALFSTNKEEFQSNGVALLDFMTYALEHEFMDFYHTSDYSLLSPGFLGELGALLNHSDQAVAIKKMMLTSGAYHLFFTYDYDNYAEGTYEAADKAAEQAAKAFVDQYWGDGYVSAAEQQQEASAFMILYFEDDALDILEGFARHPLFGSAVVEQFLTNDFLAEEYGYGDSVDMKQFYDNNPIIHTLLLNKLKSYETAALSQKLFSHYVTFTVDTVLYAQGAIESTYVQADGDMLEFVLEGLGESYFTGSKLSAGKELYAILSACPDRMRENQTEYLAMDSMHRLLQAGKNPARWPSQIIDEQEYDEYGNYTERYEVYRNFYSSLRSVMTDGTLCHVMEDMVAEKGNDPMALGKNLSQAQKDCFVQMLEAVSENQRIDPNNTNSYSDLSQYLESSGIVIRPVGDGSTVYSVGTEVDLSSFVSAEGYFFIPATGSSMTEEEIQAYNENLEESVEILKKFFGITV